MNNSTSKDFIQIEYEAAAQAKNFVVDTWQNFISFFASYQWKEIIFTAKIVSIITSLIFLALIVILLMKINIKAKIKTSVSQFKKPIVFNKKKMEKKWTKIDKKIKSGVDANYKLAVLEADNIFNNVLRDVGYEAEIKISNMDEIRHACKTKNDIIEDSRFKLDEIQAQKIIDVYKKALIDLGAI